MPDSPRKHAWHALILLLGTALLAGCASTPKRTPASGHGHAGTGIHDSVKRAPNVTEEANDVLFRAFNLVGTPYKWGGNTPASGFDCSGLVTYIYDHVAGMSLPRRSSVMAGVDAPKVTDIGELASGDLLFFDTGGGGISHVAIYVGNGQFVHAPNSGGTVRLDEITNSYWQSHFAYAKRVLH